MITLHFWPTPNGYKPLILLEELGLEYRIEPVNIFKGAQFEPAFLAISPNNRMPALIDDAPDDGGPPLALFESGAILDYLADKTGKFSPTDSRARAEVRQWLYWQIGGLGPMMGQAAHFHTFAPKDVPYAKLRYRNETERLFGVLDRRLAGHDFICGEYSIADIASYPWVRVNALADVTLEGFANLTAWADRIAARAAVERAYAVGEPMKTGQALDAEARRLLFSQTPGK